MRIYDVIEMIRLGEGWNTTLRKKSPESSKYTVSSLNKNFYNLNDRQRRAIEYAQERGAITNREYRSINNVSNVIAALKLQALVKKGVLRKEGKGRSTQYVIR